VVGRLARAERPVIYAGTGVRLAGQYERFLELAGRLGVPVVTAWNSNDLLPDDHPAYAGRPGSLGNRAGNFTVQNADVVLVLEHGHTGSWSLDFRQNGATVFTLDVDGSNGVMVGGAKVTSADIECTNGVIHVIDTVLMPPARRGASSGTRP
jgi:thiamine pyrophosphate-dependent acetolactate synthase large subunit-like protein